MVVRRRAGTDVLSTWDHTFRYDEDGRLAEEWVQTDYRSFLAKLGVTAAKSARRGTKTS